MILKIKAWCEGIIIAIIISIIIELLVPEGNNKKYVKVVVGIYIMFIILNPILQIFSYDYKFDLDKFFHFETQTTYSDLDNNIKEIYVNGIENNIKSSIENLGYVVNYIKVFVDKNYENIENIEINVSKKNNNVKIEEIIIGNKNENINKNEEEKQYNDIIKILKENYSLEEKQILFK